MEPIPATHTLVFQSEWNTEGDKQDWAPNSQYLLEEGAPIAGILTGTAAGVDPTLTRTGLNISTSSETIIEFAIRKESSDTSRIDLFWADDGGSFGGPRYTAISSAAFQADDEFKVVRISLLGPLQRPDHGHPPRSLRRCTWRWKGFLI